jgi:TonB family protein
MKSLASAITLAAVMLAASPAGAQIASPSSAVEQPRLIQGEKPIFPREMVERRVNEGDVRIVFSVDADGNLEDILPVLYTDPAFAQATVNVVKRWKFAPARYHGQPIGSTSQIFVHFELQGPVVISITVQDDIMTHIYAIAHHEIYRPHSLKELDRIPTPIATPSPAFPVRLTTPGSAGAVNVSFYIDETGAVRLPSVGVNDDPELGALAIEALRGWKFEPPTCGGRPVLVRASQQFKFTSPKAPAVPASS